MMDKENAIVQNKGVVLSQEPAIGRNDKAAWVVPEVRDYDPNVLTEAAFFGGGADFGIYS